MHLLKYRAKGADVLAAEVTTKNVLDVAEHTGGTHFVSPRTQEPYVLVERETGTQRADVGSFVVEHQDGSFEALPAGDFAARYERP